jgi:DNA-binding PadR family transcriptional regulator
VSRAAPPPPSEPTPSGYTLLGLLSFGSELSGYELKQWADNLRFFWSAPAMSQVYREVERLAAAGLVEQRRVVREGSRSTKVYRLTPEGERVVRAWLAAPPERPVLRHPVALRVFFGHLLEPAQLRAAVEAHRAWCDDMLAQLEAVRTDLGEDERWRNVAMVADWGLDYFRGERDAVDGIRQAIGQPPDDVGVPPDDGGQPSDGLGPPPDVAKLRDDVDAPAGDVDELPDDVDTSRPPELAG